MRRRIHAPILFMRRENGVQEILVNSKIEGGPQGVRLPVPFDLDAWNWYALDVLPRLTDGGYDLVFVDADKDSVLAYVEQALRLLRPGGVLAVDNALWHDRVADPAQRDAETVAVRELGRAVQEYEGLVPALLPVGDGLLVARKA